MAARQFQKKDVNFYDYDGTVVASYTASEFAELTALPENPTHEGLTAQGWNWTLSDAKTYVATYTKLNIGQMYITSDGKTRLYIELTEGRLSPYLKLYLNANSELDIDWGDGSTHSTFTNTGSSSAYSSEMHTYASAGSYIIAITVVRGGFSYKSSGSTDYTLKRVEFGSSVTNIGRSVFYECHALTSITIPSNVIGIEYVNFSHCQALTSITIPISVTGIEEKVFENCYALSSITIPSRVAYIGEYVFEYCLALTSITFESTTPPELGGDLGIPTTCVIRIPRGTLLAYTSASNYPDPSEYIYEEY